MHLYHGSPIAGLTELRPFTSNHDRPYVYLTDCPTLAMLYAHNPIERPGGFFPYYFSKDGRLHYDEYFPDQLRLMYHGHGGYVYKAQQDTLPTLDKMPWVRLSDVPVAVTACRFIPDLYDALLLAEAEGLLMLHRYESLPPQAHDLHRRVVARSLQTHGEDSYRAFIRRHMPDAEKL